jgi:hypothetical protein
MQRAKENRNPFLYTVLEEVAPVIDQLRSVERESWADAFCRLAPAHAERTVKAKSGRRQRDRPQRILDRLRLLSPGAVSGAQALIVEWLKVRVSG